MLFISSLCVTIITVLSFKYFWIKFIINFSVSLSKFDVGSSNTYISLFNSIPLIIFNLCFCPTDNLNPLSPTTVFSPFSNFSTHSFNPASFKYIINCSSSIFFPRHKFSLTVKSNKSIS